MRRTSGILSLLPIPGRFQNDNMTDQQRGNVLPELVLHACDPHLDAMTRTWIFDALREIRGENFGDDSLLWRAWYAAVTGRHAPVSKELNQSLVLAVCLQS